MKKLLGLFTILIVFIFTQTINANELHKLNEIVKGEVAKTQNADKEDKGIWIKSNQAQSLKPGSVLYIHRDTDDKTIAIVKVTTIKHRYLKVKIIDGSRVNIKVGSKVNNVFRWDGYKYLVEVIYEKGTRKISYQDELVIENQVDISSLFGAKKQEIDGREIKTLNLKSIHGRLRVKGLILKDGRSLKVESSNIEGIDKYNKKSVKLAVPGIGQVQLDSGNISAIKIVKRIEGAKKIITFHYSLGESALPIKNKDGKYTIAFKFFNFELGLKAIERMIAKENDAARLKTLISNLKLYNKDNISKVAVAGSFNNWDDSKNPMKINRQGIYEAKVPLSEGSFKYYFVLYYSGSDKMVLKVLDPYSNKVQPIGDGENKSDKVDEGENESDKVDEDEDEGDKVDEDEDEGEEDITAPGAEEAIEKESASENSDRSSGVDGKASVVEIPGPFFVKETDKVKEADKGKLPYDPDELKVEESKILSKVKVGESVIIGNICYYKVKFRFNQLRRVRTEIKRSVNREYSKAKSDEKIMTSDQDTLDKYKEEKVEGVYVTGSFNKWKAREYPLKKNSLGVWETEIFVPQGKHRYKFAVDTGIPGKEPYLIKDHYSKHFENDENSVEVSVLYAGVAEPAMEKEEKVKEEGEEGDAEKGDIDEGVKEEGEEGDAEKGDIDEGDKEEGEEEEGEEEEGDKKAGDKAPEGIE